MQKTVSKNYYSVLGREVCLCLKYFIYNIPQQRQYRRIYIFEFFSFPRRPLRATGSSIFIVILNRICIEEENNNKKSERKN